MNHDAVSLPEGCHGNGALRTARGPSSAPHADLDGRSSSAAGHRRQPLTQRRPRSSAAGSPSRARRPPPPGGRRRGTTGRACAAIWGPTASSQPAEHAPRPPSRSVPRSDRTTTSRLSPAGWDRRRQRHAVAPLDQPPGRDAQHGAGASLVGQTARRVVSTTWPAGRWREEGGGAVGIELGEHVVEQEQRRLADPLGDDPVGGEAQRQGQRPLLALRGVRCAPAARRARCRHRRDAGPTRRHAAAQVVGTAGGERRGQAGARATPGRSAAGRRPVRRPARS